MWWQIIFFHLCSFYQPMPTPSKTSIRKSALEHYQKTKFQCGITFSTQVPRLRKRSTAVCHLQPSRAVGCHHHIQMEWRFLEHALANRCSLEKSDSKLVALQSEIIVAHPEVIILACFLKFNSVSVWGKM